MAILGQLLASVELPQPVEAEPLAETLSATGQSGRPSPHGEGLNRPQPGEAGYVFVLPDNFRGS